MKKKFKPVELDAALLKDLSKARTTEQRRAITALMQRYGVHHASQLLPEQVDSFCAELKLVLVKKYKPADSTLDPKLVEIHKS